RFAWRHAGSRLASVGARFGLGAVGPRDTVAIHDAGPIHVAVHGHPAWIGASRIAPLDDFCRSVAVAWLERGDEMLAGIGGDFALAIVDDRAGRVLLAIDRVGVRNIVYQNAGDDELIFGPTSDVIAAHPRARRTLSPQALYDYVYFHMIPGPQTVWRE